MMSGRVAANSGFVTKADFAKLQAKVETILTKLAESRPEPKVVPQYNPSPHVSNRKLTGGVKSWLTSKTGSRPQTSPGTSSDDNCPCPNCGRSASTFTHRFGPAFDASSNIYKKHEVPGGNQRCLKNEFNQFQADVTREMRSLQKSVTEVQEMCRSLEKLLHESLASLQYTIDKMNVQIRANTECLNESSFESKRRVADTTRDEQYTESWDSDLGEKSDKFLARQMSRKNLQTFEWELVDVENITKNLRSVTSQPYLIEDLDYKMSGAAAGYKDGRLRLRIFGQFVEMSTKQSQGKNGKFKCEVYLIDKSGKETDWLVGNVGGDVCKDNDWMISDVYINDVIRKGYATRGGNLNLRFDVEIFV